MIKYANMRDLKVRTPEVFAFTEQGNDVIITLFQKMLDEMDKDIGKGKYRSFRQYLKEKKISV